MNYTPTLLPGYLYSLLVVLNVLFKEGQFVFGSEVFREMETNGFEQDNFSFKTLISS